MKKAFLWLTILFIYITSTRTVFAASQTITISPAIEDLLLVPGQNTTFSLQVANNGDKPVGFHEDITGIDPTNPAGLPINSPFLSWISIKPTDLLVAPHEKNSFVVTIKTPQNAKNSGYFATLFFTPFISNPLKPSGPIVLQKVGTFILATVGKLNYADLVKKVSLSDIRLMKNFWSAPSAITFRVTNSYFTHFTAKPSIHVVSMLNQKQSLFPEELHILPGGTRSWTVPITMKWYTLYSQIHLAISVGGGYQIIKQIIFINYSLILGVVIVICLVLFIIRRQKNIFRALRVLLTGHE